MLTRWPSRRAAVTSLLEIRCSWLGSAFGAFVFGSTLSGAITRFGSDVRRDRYHFGSTFTRAPRAGFDRRSSRRLPVRVDAHPRRGYQSQVDARSRPARHVFRLWPAATRRGSSGAGAPAARVPRGFVQAHLRDHHDIVGGVGGRRGCEAGNAARTPRPIRTARSDRAREPSSPRPPPASVSRDLPCGSRRRALESLPRAPLHDALV